MKLTFTLVILASLVGTQAAKCPKYTGTKVGSNLQMFTGTLGGLPPAVFGECPLSSHSSLPSFLQYYPDTLIPNPYYTSVVTPLLETIRLSHC